MIVRTRYRQSLWLQLFRYQGEAMIQVTSNKSRSCLCYSTRQTGLNSTKKLDGASQIRWMSTTTLKSNTEAVQDSPFPIFNRIAEFRKWRAQVAAKGRTVGFVPTMGALHNGHLSLVRESLKENNETVVSIFVNPAQFAPTEDLSSYPRTLSSDIKALVSLQSEKGSISAILAPNVIEMYPSPEGQPFTQNVEDQVGAFVQVQGLQEQMEGSSRPTFFRGVATVCTKLFHIVEPNLAYFGQKDIQQAIILRRLVSDLLFSYPPSAQSIRVMKTTRDEKDGLALSSRNAYLTNECRKHAPILYKCLSSAKEVWEEEKRKIVGDEITKNLIQSTLLAANQTAQEAVEAAKKDDVSIQMLYISLNDPITLQDLSLNSEASVKNDRGAILSSAALIKQGHNGRVTRLIDNVLLGFSM